MTTVGVGATIGLQSAAVQTLAARPDRLRRSAAQQASTRYEQIDQRAGHEQAMGVLFEPAIAQLGKAENPLDHPDRMFNPGRTFGLRRFFARSISSTTPRVTVTAIALGAHAPGSLLAGRGKPDHSHAGLSPTQQIGYYRAVGDIRRRRHDGVDQLAAATPR